MLAYAVLWKNDRAIWPGSALRGRLDPAPVDEMTS
jgi:hypothetical protein